MTPQYHLLSGWICTPKVWGPLLALLNLPSGSFRIWNWRETPRFSSDSVVIAHSMGVLRALSVLRKDTVRKAVLISGCLRFPAREQVLRSMKLLARKSPEKLRGDFSATAFAPEKVPSPDLFELPQEDAGSGLDYLRDADATPFFGRIETPLTIFHGLHDRIIPFGNALPGSRPIEAGHMLPYTQPELIVRTL